jgi:hypothetical protein
MITIGMDEPRKLAKVAAYVAEHRITNVVVLYPERFPLAVPGAELVEYREIIMYRTYYRLLQEIGPRTLVVVHECMRTTDRGDLTYNCIRHFLAQTPHVLVFQALPMIEAIDDFAVLFDFATKSRWKHLPFAELPIQEARIELERRTYAILPTHVPADPKTAAKYAATKRAMIDGIGHRDPHTIPRNLHMVGAKLRAAAVPSGSSCVGRAQRDVAGRLATYAAQIFDQPCVVLDFPHRYLDWCDFVALSGQSEIEAIVSDLRADQWYLERFSAWCQRVNDGQAALHG